MSTGDNTTSSAPLSDADAFYLYSYGLVVTQDAAGVIFETIFMSIYGVFFCVALYSIFRKGIKSRSSLIMLLVVVYLYATSLTLWGLNVTVWFLRAHALFMDVPNMPLSDRFDYADDLLSRKIPLGIPEEALFMFNMIVGDSVVIWRVWVIYQRQLRAVIIPMFLLLVSFVFNIIDLTCLISSRWSASSAVAGGGAVCANAELISWAVSLGTNASCTILIGIKAWKHRRMMRSLDVQKPKKMASERVLSLLVESGFIYCLFWLTQVVLFLPISRLNASIYFYDILGALGDQISGLYPTLIIVIVNFNHTIWDGTRSGDTGNVSTSTVRWMSSRPDASGNGKQSKSLPERMVSAVGEREFQVRGAGEAEAQEFNAKNGVAV